MKRNCLGAVVFAVMSPLLHPAAPLEATELTFGHKTLANGLSNNTVRCVIQDSRGFMWFGTPNGLNKYDGYTFTVYQNDSREPAGTNCLDVSALFEDGAGNIWMGTKSCGLFVYDREKDRVVRPPFGTDSSGSFITHNVQCVIEDSTGCLWFGGDEGLFVHHKNTVEETHYQHVNDVSTTLGDSPIHCILEDRKNRLWIGSRNGLSLLDRTTGRSRRYFHDSTTGADAVMNIYEDGAGDLWLASYHGGAIRFDPEDMTYHRYLHESKGKNTISSNNVFCITGDDQGLLYFGTENGGLDVLDPETGKFSHHRFGVDEPGGLTSNSIYSLYHGSNEILWVGTYNGGINYTSRLNPAVRHYKAAKGGLNNPHILTITENKAGNLWIGTDGGGLNYLDRRSGKYTCYLHNERDTNSLGGNEVTAVWEDSRGKIWAGLYQAGLDLFDPHANRFAHSRHVPSNSNTIQDDLVNVVLEDRRGNFFVGTGTGLDFLDRRTNIFKHNPFGNINTGVVSMIEDRQGNLWVGTYGGLSFVDLAADTARNYLHFEQGSEMVRTPAALCEDHRGHIWIGTWDGLFVLDRLSQAFLHYPLDKVSSNNAVFGIVEDARGNLWISNGRNLLEFEGAALLPRKPIIVDFGIYDGINKLHQSAQGEIFFGGNQGFNALYPQSVVKNHHLPPVVITSFSIFGEDAEIGAPGSPLHKQISETKELVLSSSQTVISFEFAALSYFLPEKNQYAYLLEGFDREWNFVGNQRTATYTNLDPGEYVFRVKGSNNDGVWNETGTSVRITVVPPWWKTSRAILSYSLILGMLIYGVWRFQLNRERMKHELALEHLHAEKLEEVGRMKSRFFANITHEFRTPLSLIIGQAKELLDLQAPAPSPNRLQAILRNGHRLYHLVNQLLDLSRLEAGHMRLRVRKLNIASLLRDLVMLIMPLAERKQVALRFSMGNDPNDHLGCIEGFVDQDKLEKIVSNLLSNAIKFTPTGGKIDMSVKDTGDGWIEIVVRDNGPGIPEKHLEKVFDRFYQIDDSSTRSHEGTGIGLAVTKELVELHHGTVRVESSAGGATFFVWLPLDKAHFSENEIITETPQSAGTDAGIAFGYDGYEDSRNGKPPEKSHASSKSPLILIVEDNTDLRHYLRHNLDHEYRVIEAKDGREGIDKAIATIPDLIVSDVMMPSVDGFELCAVIKKDERTCHIPVILLTARTSSESKNEGLELGADDYIIKPFEMKELLVRARNLIDQRQQLRLHFNRKSGLRPEEIAATPRDERILKKALAVIEENMSDPNFGVAEFARKIAMSRVQLHRKIHGLTGQSTSEFIRVVRLNRAAQLLKQKHDNITQIAFLVGFSSSSYFSRSFCRHFGIPPSEYAENHPA